MNITDLIHAAMVRADRDVAQGIIDLEAAITVAPEWGRSDRRAIPVRASLVGMRDHLREAYAANHPNGPKMCATLGEHIDDPGDAQTSPGPANPVEGDQHE